MKKTVEKRKPSGIVDYIALALTTWGVGYLPLMPGTFGSMVGVAIYFGVVAFDTALGAKFTAAHYSQDQITAISWASNSILLIAFVIVGIWASGRSIAMLGNTDPNEAVVDEVLGTLTTLLFIPQGASWIFVLVGFALFRLFDIWKPYPIDSLQTLPAGVGVCADDIVAGVYAGMCLSITYAVMIVL